MAGRYPLTSLVAIGLILINLAAWVVLLGGAAGLQSDAVATSTALNTFNSNPGTNGFLATGDLWPSVTSGNFISYEWYKAVFQVVTLLFALGALALGQLFHFRIALVGLFAALGVLFSDSCQTFYYLYLQTHNLPNDVVPSKIKKEIQVYWSGCIMSAALNFLTVIALGIGAESTGYSNTGYGRGAATDAGVAPGVKDTTNGATSPAV